MRSEVTAEVLEKVAARLGRDYAVKKDLWGRPVIFVRGNPAWRECSDGDLLLAILNKTVEMHVEIELLVCGKYVKATIPYGAGRGEDVHVGRANNPLEAAMLAFAQLPESP